MGVRYDMIPVELCFETQSCFTEYYGISVKLCFSIYIDIPAYLSFYLSKKEKEWACLVYVFENPFLFSKQGEQGKQR